MTGTNEGAALVGRFFHTMAETGATFNQGCVLAYLGDGYYLVQLFSWVDGAPTTQHIFNVSAMLPAVFRFFSCKQDMTAYYTDVASKRDRQIVARFDKATQT